MRRSTPVTDDPDVRLLHALADPTRLGIVRELGGGGTICACDFTATCGVSQPTVSHHLRILREAGVVRAQRRGTSIDYSLVPGIFDRLAMLARGLVPG
jgi:ArsR family transcriptional regulator, arsenate/arsenite/antimonite-responsive transcriptional repressor